MVGFTVVFVGIWILANDAFGKPASANLYNTRNITTDLGWTASPILKGWEEVSGFDETTRRTIRYYQVCNRDNPDADNWVRTPYIASRGAERAYIDVNFSMMKCDKDNTKNCRETFNLYYYESDSDVASSTFPPWRERPYIKIDTIAAGKRFTMGDTNDQGVNKKTWTLGPLKRNGFYIAAHDKGACMSLLSLRVYYFYCPKTTIALATFPRTVAGQEIASLVTVNGICVNNSKRASDHGPRFHCNSNGEWQIRTGMCQCLPGYQAKENLKSCDPCGKGKYKTRHGNHECLSCPRNSYSSTSITKELAVLRSISPTISRIDKPTFAPDYCKCLPGYFRAADEDVHQPCTRPPSAPAKVKYVVNETSATMKWEEPADHGDRVDIFYKITCERCKSEAYDSCTDCGSEVTFEPGNVHLITTNQARVSKLHAYTYYQFKIYALNGVSSVAKLPEKYALVQVMTNQAAPSPVTDVRAVETLSRSFTLAWSLPQYPNGKVIGYEVRIQQLNIESDRDKSKLSDFLLEPNRPVLYETANRSMAVSELKPGKTYQVQVRAHTAAGYGEFSNSVMARTEKEGDVAISGATDPSRLALVVGVGASLVFVIAVVIAACFRLKSRKHGSSREKVSFEDARQLVVRLPSASSTQKLYIDYSDPQTGVRELACEIDQALIKIEDTIGQGEFGEVFRGKLLGTSDSRAEGEQVAIKKLKQGANVKDQLNFLREACTMAQFDNPNVLVLMGVVTKTRPMMIVSEYMENGSLNNFLKRHQGELSVLQLTNMHHGIAIGMNYLSQMQFVHRDLAARNILVNSDLVCKVSDFGLSRTLENDPRATYTTQGGKIALRWTAPECIHFREFTSASDVWSYGIVMWEIMSFGEKPYWDMTNQDVLDSVDEGYRLPAPYECPGVLHKIMIECWTMDPNQRPTFERLVGKFEEIMTSPELLKASSSPTSSTSAPGSDGVFNAGEN